MRRLKTPNSALQQSSTSDNCFVRCGVPTNLVLILFIAYVSLKLLPSAVHDNGANATADAIANTIADAIANTIDLTEPSNIVGMCTVAMGHMDALQWSVWLGNSISRSDDQVLSNRATYVYENMHFYGNNHIGNDNNNNNNDNDRERDNGVVDDNDRQWC